MGFLTNFFTAGGQQALDGVTSALVQAAPNLGGKAQLATMDQDLDSMGAVISDFGKQLREAQTEYNHVHSQYDELMGAAEVMQGQVTEIESKIAAENTKPEPNQTDLSTWTARRASLATSLDKLVGQIEHILPTVDKDKNRIDKLTEDLATARELYRVKASTMVNSGAELEEAKHDLAHAKLDEQRAQQDAENARRLAGLSTGSGNGMTAATDALRRATEASQQRAEVLDLKASTLKATKDTAKGDENIQAALALAKGSTSSASLSDRMAALRR